MVRLNVNITEELNARLDNLAERDGITKSELLRKAIALVELAVNVEIHFEPPRLDGKLYQPADLT